MRETACIYPVSLGVRWWQTVRRGGANSHKFGYKHGKWVNLPSTFITQDMPHYNQAGLLAEFKLVLPKRKKNHVTIYIQFFGPAPIRILIRHSCSY